MSRIGEVYEGKRVKSIEREYCTLKITFHDGSTLHVEAEGYEGTKLSVTGEYIATEVFSDD